MSQPSNTNIPKAFRKETNAQQHNVAKLCEEVPLKRQERDAKPKGQYKEDDTQIEVARMLRESLDIPSLTLTYTLREEVRQEHRRRRRKELRW